MTTITITLSLPDEIALAADAHGLLTADALEQLILEEMNRQQHRHLYEIMKRLAALPDPPLNQDEVNAEIAAVRTERRERHAPGS